MEEKTASEQIDNIISSQTGWKHDILTQIRAAIKQADSEVTEEIKWRMATRPEGLAVWSHNGILCFAEIWKDNIKLLFPKGARLKDSHGLFNSRLKSSSIRAIEFKEGDRVEEALQGLIKEAARINIK